MKSFAKNILIGLMVFTSGMAFAALPLTGIAVTERPEAASGGAFDGERYLVGLQLDGQSNAVQFLSAAGIPQGAPIPIPGAVGMPPEVAYGTNVFLAVWVGADGYVRGQFISRAGVLLRETFFVSGTHSKQDYGSCRVASGAGYFLVAWEDLWAEGMTPDAGTDIIGHLVPEEYLNAPPGLFPPNPLQKGVVISLDDGATIEVDDANLSIAFDGLNFLVVFSRDGGDDGEDVCGRFVSPLAGPLGARFMIDQNDIPSSNPTATVFANGQYAVLFHESVAMTNAESWQIYAKFVSTNGVVAGDRILLAGNEEVAAQFPSLGWNGVHFLVALREGAPDHWEEGAPASESDFLDTNAVIRARWYDSSFQPVSDWMDVTGHFGDNEAVLGTLMLPYGNGFALGIQTISTNWIPVNVYGAVVPSELSSLFSTVTIWRSLEMDGPALFEVDVSAPTGKAITVTVPTEPPTVYDLAEDAFVPGEYEYYDNTLANALSVLNAHYPQGDYVLRLYSDSNKTNLEETLAISFGTDAPLPFPEVYPALTQPAPSGGTLTALPDQAYVWNAYSGTPGTATHMTLAIDGTGEGDEGVAWYDAQIAGISSYTPPAIPSGDYDLELSFFFRKSSLTPYGTMIECANERYSKYALMVCALSADNGPYGGGNTITITNGAFGSVTNVLVGGRVAAIVGSSDNWVTVTIPALVSAGVKDIVIQTSDHADVTLADAYTVNQQGVIGLNIKATLVAGGACHSLGLKSDGSITGWGYNTWGQTAVPSPNTDFVAVAAGYYHSLGLKSDGSIVAWGYNYDGQTAVPSPNTDFVAVAASGGHHSLGLKSDGSIVAWGYNYNGQTAVPSPNTDFVAVAAGHLHSLGLKSNGSVVSWGASNQGQTTVPSPNTDFVSIAAGYWHSLGLKSDGSIVAWGDNSYGQTAVPEPNANFVAVVGGRSHSIGLKSDGSIVAWGSNEFGQTAVPEPNADFVAIAAAEWHSLGLKSDGSIVAWGSNFCGETSVPAPNTGFGPPNGVQPNMGTWFGGDEVFIRGMNLGNGSDITNVTLCGVSAAIVSQSSTQIVVTTGVGTPGKGNVVICSVSRGVTVGNDMFTYQKTSQTITFPAIDDKLMTDTVGLLATASSGLPVAFSILSGPALMSDSTNLTFMGAGTISVMASQAGDAYWNAAPSVTNTFHVTNNQHQLTVNNGSGSGSYTNGAVVAITAHAPEAGYQFACWTGDTQYVASVTSPSTTVTIPDQDIAISATYAPCNSVLVADTFGGAENSPPDASKFEWSGEVFQNGSGELYLGTWYVNTSWIRSKAGAAPIAGQALVLQMRLSAYAEPTVYGDGQPRGLRVGGDPNNAVEFFSIFGTTLGMRVVKDGVVSQASYAFPQGVNFMHDYEISVTTTQVIFKVDGVVTGTFTENIPTGILNFYVSTFDGGLWAGNVPVSIDSMLLTFTGSSTYLLTVNNGAGSGAYTNGAVVAITANAPAVGYQFDCWTGDTQYVASVTSAATTLTMPASAISLTATYKNTLANALGCPNWTFETGGDLPWFIQSAVAWEGTTAAQSGAIGHRQTSWMQTSIAGAGRLSFRWKVSCEDDELDDWDYVAFSVDGIEVARRDGEMDWSLLEIELPSGPHMVRWTYVKDRVVSAGSDCAWVDDVVWTPASQATLTTPVPVPYAWLDDYALVSGGDYESAAFADTDEDGHKAWEEYVAGTSPVDPSSVLRVQIHFEAGEPVITWVPDLGTLRRYTIEGRDALDTGNWGPKAPSNRFFRVKVEMP